MKDQLISAALNIAGGLVAAVIYDWFRDRLRPAPRPSEPKSLQLMAHFRPTPERERRAVSSETRLPVARGGPDLFRGLFSFFLLLAVGTAIYFLLLAAGIAVVFVLHRFGLGAQCPGLEVLLRQGAIIALSMGMFVWLFGRLRRRA